MQCALPAPTCHETIPQALDWGCVYAHPTENSNQWHRYDLVIGRTYRLLMNHSTGNANIFYWYEGNTCDQLFEIIQFYVSGISGGSYVFDWRVATKSRFYVRWQGSTFGGPTYTLNVQTQP